MSIIDYSWDFTTEDFSLDLDFFNEKDQEDKLWQAKTGLDHESVCGAIESLIFMSDRPINIQKIKSHIDSDLPLRVIHESIVKLQGEYEQKHHGIRLMEVAEGYQFRTKASYSKQISKMYKIHEMQLSPTALEVLTIIAYKQPVSKNSIESLRGVDSSHVVRQLMDKRLVKVCGRSEEIGRPSLYGTSSEFLEVFNLKDITELPSEIELTELAEATELGEISDIKNIVKNPNGKSFVFDEFNELEELSQTISEILPETVFTSTLKTFEKKRKTDDGEIKRSAFDILEDFVSEDQIVKQNQASAQSDVIMTFMEPKSVAASQLEQMLNMPRLEDDELEIEVELEDQVDEILAQSADLLETQSPEDELDLEKQELSDALDDAFDKLMVDNEQESAQPEDDKVDDSLLAQAKDFDIDLSAWD